MGIFFKLSEHEHRNDYHRKKKYNSWNRYDIFGRLLLIFIKKNCCYHLLINCKNGLDSGFWDENSLLVNDKTPNTRNINCPKSKSSLISDVSYQFMWIRLLTHYMSNVGTTRLCCFFFWNNKWKIDCVFRLRLIYSKKKVILNRPPSVNVSTNHLNLFWRVYQDRIE